MLELIVDVCLSAQPTVCEETRLLIAVEAAVPAQCAMLGQFEMAKWIGEHPQWKIVRFRCAGTQDQTARF